jgi:hypothetical protein
MNEKVCMNLGLGELTTSKKLQYIPLTLKRDLLSTIHGGERRGPLSVRLGIC